DLRTRTGSHALDATSTRVDVAGNRTHVFFRRNNLDLHDGLEQHWIGFLCSVLKRHRSGYFECHFRRVDFVKAPEGERCLYVHHFVARQDATFHSFLDPFVHRLDVLARDYTADNCIYKLVASARFRRLNRDFGVSILTAATGLTYKLADTFCGFPNRLAIRDLGPSYVRVDTKFSLQSIDDDLQVQLTHSADDRLAGFLISGDFEAWIFRRKALKANVKFLLVLSGFGFDCLGNYWCGEFESFQNDWVGLSANGIASGDLLESGNRDDFAGGRLFDIFAFVCVHAHNPADALFRASR